MTIASPVRTTPVLAHRELGVVLKLENLQRTGSFKLRGAWRKLRRLGPGVGGGQGVITASAGNHGAGLAVAAAALGVRARVVVPEGAPAIKRRRIADAGAEVIVHGSGYDAAHEHACSLGEELGAELISAFDDDDIIAGNGQSLAEELLMQVPDLRRVVAPVGGGGLVGGLTLALVPRGIEVVGAQPRANCAMYESLELGRALTAYDGAPTVAEGCEGAVAERTFRIVRDHDVTIALVGEDAIEQAVADAYRRVGQIVECSGAVALAAVATGTVQPAGEGTTAVIVSGGNIDDATLDDILARYPE